MRKFAIGHAKNAWLEGGFSGGAHKLFLVGFDQFRRVRSPSSDIASRAGGAHEIRIANGEPEGPRSKRESRVPSHQIIQQARALDAVAARPEDSGEVEEALWRFSRQGDRLAAPKLGSVEVSGFHEGPRPGDRDGGIVRPDTGQGAKKFFGFIGAPQHRVTARQKLPTARVGRLQDHERAGRVPSVGPPAVFEKDGDGVAAGPSVAWVNQDEASEGHPSRA